VTLDEKRWVLAQEIVQKYLTTDVRAMFFGSSLCITVMSSFFQSSDLVEQVSSNLMVECQEILMQNNSNKELFTKCTE
jgi:hypothetical protein